jgi:alcohol dehydrogenase (cytochrome c)
MKLARIFPLFTALVLLGQGLSPATLLKQQPTDAWPTYSGDYSGRRFSPLTQINSSNVHTLSLAWATRFTSAGGGAAIQIKSTPLMVNNILYFTAPNHVWAVDARDGHELWHYQYPPNTGSTIGNRGVGMYGAWLFFESPDSHLISLDARTGKERWKVSIANPKLDYTSTAVPIVIGNHIMVGIGGDHLDNPGFLLRPGRFNGNGLPRPARASPALKPGPMSTLRRTEPGRRGFQAATIPS